MYGNAYSQNTKNVLLQRVYLQKTKIKKKERFLKDVITAMKTALGLFFPNRIQPGKPDLYSIH